MHDPLFPRRLAWLAAAATVTAPLWAYGCVLDAGDLPPPEQGEADAITINCEDADGDGLGHGCPRGADCDDADAAITTQCFQCQHDEPGCPCTDEGKRTMCGHVESQVGEQVVCGLGDSVCTEGRWGECIINNTITLAAGAQPQSLGAPSPCAGNPCDPYCQSFLDTPTGLGDLDAGIAASDAGLSLVGSTPPPPALCTGGSDGTCAHAMCVTGAKLASGCDYSAPPPGAVVLFTEDFASNAKGWTTTNAEWQVAQSATASSGQQTGNADPSADHTTTADNRIAGVKIGGNATTSTHAYYYLVSPVINAGPPTQSPVTLQFWRWLNSDYANYMVNRVEACNGLASCVVLWQSGGAPGVADSAWTSIQLAVPAAYATASLQIRFGVYVGTSGGSKASSWNIDDVTVSGVGPAPPVASCVSAVCSVLPSCCTTSWTQACIDKLAPSCNVTCGNLAGKCVSCWKDAYDHDGDGTSGAAGDCLDCDPNVNPGAYDFPANGADEDCSGTADDEVAHCDGALPMASTSAYDFAKAMGLCKTATSASKGWGVVTPGAALVQASVDLQTGTPVTAPNALSYGILTRFGPNNVPLEGTQMAAFSSGTARAPSDPGWIDPNGQVQSYDAGKSCALPPTFPKGSSCYPSDAATTANDSSGLWMQIKVPSNARSFSFDFDMFSAEYPEWVCTAYNDTFIARLFTAFASPQNPASNGNNISFDALGKPITINNAFFTIPGCPSCASTKLQSTSFDAMCGTARCGGSTDWLLTTAPVVPGETIDMHFSVWDEGDHLWDSIVLVDKWQWSVDGATISTIKQPPPPVTTYADGYFTRDYDASHACPAQTSIAWGLWSWKAVTPGDSSIDFTVKAAATQAGLASAEPDALQFSTSPGPTALAGKPAVAKAGPPDTTSGSAVVDATLDARNRSRTAPFLRVTSHLAPSTDKLKAPTLSAWNLQIDCIPSE